MEFDLRNSQLFLDDAIIEQSVRLQRVMHQPHKYFDNPVYTVGAPWEGTGIVYLGGVYIDPADGLWRAWYVTLSPPEYPEIQFAICMIVSDDGIHWRRPELDVYRGRNGEKTNIVLDLGPAGRTTAPTILHEPDADEPWTMFISLCWPPDSKHYLGYFLKSPDGVHWRWVQERPNGFEHGFHDRTTATFSGNPDYPYLLIGRGKEDITRWNLPRTAHRLACNLTEAEPGEPTRVLVPDLEDDPAGQIYHAQAFPYEGVWVGLFQWYWEVNEPWGEMALLFSRDAKDWKRPRPRSSFLPPAPGGGAGGAFDCAITDTALSPPIRTSGAPKPAATGDLERQLRAQYAVSTLWFYYWGGQAMHGSAHLTFGRGLGLAQLRADGFCSLRANRFPGTLTTVPIEWPGGELSINASVLGGSGAGELRCEVLTEALDPISGLSLADADPVTSNSTALRQTWNGDAKKIDSLRRQQIRLRFHLDNMDLFSFKAVVV